MGATFATPASAARRTVWSSISCCTSRMSRLPSGPIQPASGCVVARAGADLQQPLAGSRLEGLAQTFRVMNGCGGSTQKRWEYGHADGFLRHQRAAPTVATRQRQLSRGPQLSRPR